MIRDRILYSGYDCADYPDMSAIAPSKTNLPFVAFVEHEAAVGLPSAQLNV